jgi:PAS domain S-box-containing protein/diguanylate cyclase (GGDEF)-like protein
MKLQGNSNVSASPAAKGSTAPPQTNSEGRYRNLIQNLPQAVFETDQYGHWSFLNESWRQLSGFGLDECIGTSYLSYVHPQDRTRCKQVFAKLQRSEVGHCTEAFRFLIKNGSYLWMEVHAAPLRSPACGFAGIVGTLINITDRVSEEELLLADQRTLTAMLNDLPGMVYRCRNNPDWTMEYVSGSSYELTGYYPQDIVNNKKLSYGSMIHPDDKQVVWNEVQNGVREDRRFELEYRIVTATGKEKWVWERGRGIFSNNDELLGLEGFITDITQKRAVGNNELKGMLYDAVTGLPTLYLFMDRIEVAIRRSAENGYTPALCVMHLDRVLKAFEQLDIEAVDRAAREVGQRLALVVGPLDSVTRLDYERWGILIENPGGKQSITDVSQRIQDAFLSPIMVGASKVYVTVSIGVALCAEPHQSADDLLRDASHAMHRANALGGGRCEVFDPRIHKQSIAAL